MEVGHTLFVDYVFLASQVSSLSFCIVSPNNVIKKSIWCFTHGENLNNLSEQFRFCLEVEWKANFFLYKSPMGGLVKTDVKDLCHFFQLERGKNDFFGCFFWKIILILKAYHII